MLVQMLIDTVSKGGNLLLNVGPTGRGEFDERALSCLSGMGKWMKNHGRSIYGCTQAPDEFTPPRDCRLTYNPDTNRLYIHMFGYPFGGFFMDGKEICERIEYAQFLNDASEIRYSVKDGTVSFNIPVVKPNVTVPVIEVYLK
jgi:alpha-L-fucosidase